MSGLRLFVWGITLFCVAAACALLARVNMGNVAFFLPTRRIDLSFNLFLLLMGGLFLGVYTCLRILHATQNLPHQVVAYRRKKQETSANTALRDALKALCEGRFGQALIAATRAAQGPSPLKLAALIGALAAHKLGQTERRDQWLSSLETDTELKTAQRMMRLTLFVDEHNTPAALEVAAELNASGTRHIQALRLALKAHQQAGHWREVIRLVRILDKVNALRPLLSEKLRASAYQALFKEMTNNPPPDEQSEQSLRALWDGVLATERTHPLIAESAALAFNQHQCAAMARRIIEEALQKEWHPHLLRTYRACVAAPGSTDLRAQIEQCETWKSQQASSVAELSLTLGTLCLQQQLWGKAERYLQEALSDATPKIVGEAHYRLAQLYETLEKPQEAATYYRLCALSWSGFL